MSEAKKAFYKMQKNTIKYNREDIYDICIPYILELEEQNKSMWDILKHIYDRTKNGIITWQSISYIIQKKIGKSVEDTTDE